MRQPTKEEKEAIQTVLYDLERYNGEEIVKDEHPLHLSIQRLESFCFKRRHDSQPYALWSPAMFIWYYTLWASRNGFPNSMEYSFYDFYNGNGLRRPKTIESTDANPAIALGWAQKLRDELEPWLVDFPTKHRYR